MSQLSMDADEMHHMQKVSLSLPKPPLSYGQILMWYLAVKLNTNDILALDIPIII